MDRCPLCKAPATFYGVQNHPVTARWLVCYACRGGRQTASGWSDTFTFRTDDGIVGTVMSPPNKALFDGVRTITIQEDDDEQP